MERICFVCHGNICRSPMAEFVMKALVRSRGLEKEYQIESAATSTEEIGNPVYPPARRILSQSGIPVDPGKTAQQFARRDYARFDHIICMEKYNVRNLMRIIGDDPEGKVTRLLDWTETPGDVADPWYTGDFQSALGDILTGCEGLLIRLQASR